MDRRRLIQEHTYRRVSLKIPWRSKNQQTSEWVRPTFARPLKRVYGYGHIQMSQSRIFVPAHQTRFPQRIMQSRLTRWRSALFQTFL
ncbi:hypothetical protein AA23498_1045 [Acetobacter nitrogenifigens DSM 23921 = NBRC 105050]|nr:hypothetical protein AA23498_1045 [Acetobacter nitrogenifigens DSM 23921 = NBRC 105050]